MMLPWEAVMWSLYWFVGLAVAFSGKYSFEADSGAWSDILRRQSQLGLRIMPLGASNTAGVGSTPEDGYRRPLRDMLRGINHDPVNMVGSQTSPGARMRNGAHEGYSGRTISGVAGELRRNGYLNRRPNVVLIHAGTNNCRENVNVDDGHEQLESLVIDIMNQVPGVAVIMSTLPPLVNQPEAHRRCQEILNPNIRQTANALQRDGRKVRLADIGGGLYITESDIGPDGIHFNQEGYRKVAELWFEVIQELHAEGLIDPPELTEWPDVSEDSGNTCPKRAGDGYGPVESQFGRAGADDGVYSHSSEYMGNPQITGTGNEAVVFLTEAAPQNIFFAQLVNPTGDPDRNHIQDEIISWESGREYGMDRPRARLSINRGNLQFDRFIEFDVNDGPGCTSRGLWWGDVNNDGLDDYICIGAEGNMYVSLNRGGIPPRFEMIGLYKSAEPGYEQRHVRLGDIDGDGRLDYCVTSDSGDIRCWRNTGVGDRPWFWQDMGPVFDGQGMGQLAGSRFVDINGDHRYDWVWVDDNNGATRIFTNSRGRFDGGRPLWREASRAHAGLGNGDAHRRVKFARLFSSDRPAADYVHIETSRFNVGSYLHRMVVYRNTGTGGTRLRADGNRYADMTGNGRDDLLWIRSTGEVTWWENRNPGGHTSSPWTWGVPVDIFNVNRDGGNRDRRGVHFADWDGDGICDVLYHDKVTGQVEWWRNGEGQGVYEYRGRIGPTCNTGIGFGVFDLGVRFADIDGDGRADFLCMEPDGRTTAYLNTETGLRNMGQVKVSERHERVNHRWADVNGDGRADFLWMDNFNGDTHVWYNEGEVQERISGSSFRWTPMGRLYDGQSRSTNQYFPDFDGNGRADLHHINPLTNTGVTWFNICPRGGSGQDDPDMNPDFPAPPSLCAVPLCSFYDYCGNAPYVIDEGTLEPIPYQDDGNARLRRRSSSSGDPRPIVAAAVAATFTYTSVRYPNIRYYLENTPAGVAHNLYTTLGTCANTIVSAISADDPATGRLLNPLPPAFSTSPPALANLDHPFDLQTMKLFLNFAVTRERLTGGLSGLTAVSRQLLIDTWNNPTVMPPGAAFRTINDLVMSAYGSSTQFANFVPIEAGLNLMKASVFGCIQPLLLEDGRRDWTRLVEIAMTGGQADREALEARLHNIFSVFEMVNVPDYLQRMNNVIADIRRALVTATNIRTGYIPIVPLWDEFIGDFFEHLTQTAWLWAREACIIIDEQCTAIGTDQNNRDELWDVANKFFAKLDEIYISGRSLPRP